MKNSKVCWRISSFLGLFLCLFISVGNASAEEKKFQWSTRLTVSEQYDDNVNLENDNKDDDWITSVGPGFTLAILREKTSIKLDYDLNYAYYANDTSGDTLRHTLALTGLEGVPITKHLTLDLNESLFISDDPIEEEEGVTSVRDNRRTYYRNSAGGRINYLFGEADLLYVGFHHELLKNNDSSVQDGQTYEPAAGIAYWFNIHNGLSLDFSYDRADFDESKGAVSDDYRQYIGSATYTYRFSPRTQTFLAYTFDSFDYDDNVRVSPTQEDYVVHSGSLGLSHQFTKNTSALISGGYWQADRDHTNNKGGFQGAVNFTQTLEKFSFALDGSTGYRQQFLQAENFGLTKYYRASATLSYQPMEKLTTGISGFYMRDEYEERVIENRDDDTWGGNAGLNYLLLPWLSASLSYDYRQRDSTDSTDDYTDNRVTFSLVAFYLSEAKSF